VLRKDITRFAPVWVLYTVFLLLCVLVLSDGPYPGTKANSVAKYLSKTVWLNLLYAPMNAVLVFGDLFRPRACNTLHTMPLRREGWFLTHTLAGLLFSIVPNLICALSFTIQLQQFSYMIWLWLATSVLQYLFFFGAAALSVLCAGNYAGMLSIYGMINFLSGILYQLAELFYEPLHNSIRLDAESFHAFMPSIRISNNKFVVFYYEKLSDSWIWGGFIAESWHYLFAVAGVGLLFLVAALLLYRRRKLERTGDFLSLRFLSPVILILCALIPGGILYSLADRNHLSFPYLYLIIGLAIGFFPGMMVLNRTTQVFQPKKLLYFFLLCAVLLGSIPLVRLDPLGITRHVPQASQVQWARIQETSNADSQTPLGTTFVITDPAEIEGLCSIHQALVEDPDDFGSTIQIEYKLKSGIHISRYYQLSAKNPLYQELTAYFSDWRYIFQTDDWDGFSNSVTHIAIYRYNNGNQASNNPEFDLYTLKERFDIRQLLDAIKQDSQAGTMAQDWGFSKDAAAWLYLNLTHKDTTFHLGLYIYSDCTKTVELLNSYCAAE
jgi:ABC-2 type transport system permease protein